MSNDPNNTSLGQAYIVYFAVLLFGILILGSTILVMTKEHDELMKLAKERNQRETKIESTRGNILSCDGNLIATSVPVFDLGFDPTVANQGTFNLYIDSLCRQLAQLFPKKNAAQWKKEFCTARAKGKQYCPIEKNASLQQSRKAQTFVIFKEGRYRGGFRAEKHTRREHPYKELANLTIGLVNEKNSYYFGLEGAYNEQLKGVDGLQVERQLHNHGWMPVESEKNRDVQDGNDIVTTLDMNLQDIVENALQKAMISNAAERGCAILMDVETGQIRALANQALEEEEHTYGENFNFALTELYEPGSVFKIASMVVLLNHNHKIKPSDTINIGNGPIKFSSRPMRDDHVVRSSGRISVAEVIEQSSNKGTAVLITRQFAAHPEQYVEGLYALGLNKMSGLGIYGEAQPKIKHPDDKNSQGQKLWSKVSLPWMSIGYEVNVTPMQLLTLYNAIANNGKMMKPQLVTDICNGNQVVKHFEPEVLNEQIASPEGIAMLQNMLEGVTLRGTARKQLSDCIVRTAGKTGTAQYCHPELGYKYRDPATGRHLYNTTFVGYFPADNPRYSCIVVISRAHGRYWAAGGVCAPCFREIAEKVYALRIGEEIDWDDSLHHENQYAPAMQHHDEMRNYLEGLGTDYTDYATGGEWVTMTRDEKGETSLHKAEIKPNRIPDVTGMDVTEAVYLLENMGIKTTFSGFGTVSQQSLEAGDTIKAGSIMQLKLEKQ